MQSNRSCRKVKHPRWQRNRPVSNPQSGCICEIREICGLIIFLLPQKIVLTPYRGGTGRLANFSRTLLRNPQNIRTPRTSLAAGNYRSYASDKVERNKPAPQTVASD